jgi:glyoxylase-like metal-dependent hydrolase (beta-lactamase superfamily II)
VVFPGHAAIVGDLVVGRINAPRRPAYPMWTNNPEPFKASVRRVLDYSPKLIYSGHGGPLDADEVRRFFLG